MKRGIQHLLVLLLTALTLCANSAVSFAAQTNTQANKSYYQKGNKAPHSELKLVESQVQGASGQQVNKLSSPSFLYTPSQSFYPANTISLLKSVYTIQLVRDYLFFIYPSHNFW